MDSLFEHTNNILSSDINVSSATFDSEDTSVGRGAFSINSHHPTNLSPQHGFFNTTAAASSNQWYLSTPEEQSLYQDYAMGLVLARLLREGEQLHAATNERARRLWHARDYFGLAQAIEAESQNLSRISIWAERMGRVRAARMGRRMQGPASWRRPTIGLGPAHTAVGSTSRAIPTRIASSNMAPANANGSALSQAMCDICNIQSVGHNWAPAQAWMSSFGAALLPEEVDQTSTRLGALAQPSGSRNHQASRGLIGREGCDLELGLGSRQL